MFVLSRDASLLDVVAALRSLLLEPENSLVDHDGAMSRNYHPAPTSDDDVAGDSIESVIANV